MERTIKFKSEYLFIILLGIALIASIIGNGWQHEQRGNLKKEVKELRKSSERIVNNSKKQIDTVYLYIDSAKIAHKEVIKAKIKKEKIIHETKQKVQALDSFSYNAHLKLFHERARQYRQSVQ